MPNVERIIVGLGDVGRVFPHVFKAVVGPNVFLENMNENVSVIEKDPLRRGFSFHGAAVPEPAQRFPSNGFGNGFDVAFGISRAYNEIVGNRGEGFRVKDEDVGGLFIQDDAADDQDFAFDV